MTPPKETRDQIEDYQHTVCAILLFMNFYRYDDENACIRKDVVVFQGRRFSPSAEKATTTEGNAVEYVTPDLGVMHKPGRNLLGDVKKSFPKDRKYWAEDFRQLLAYDDDLIGWPCAGERVTAHDVVLLTHQSRATVLCDYYEERTENGEVRFLRPFAIISFNRSDERRPFFYFEKRLGSISDKQLDEKLRLGVSVPMDVLTDLYSTVKLYDAPPPLPYLASLIWEHVVTPRASDNPKFRLLRKNQKIEVTINVDEIVEELSNEFSFRCLCPDHPERQPKIPKKEWCVRACDAMVKTGMASWPEAGSKDTITVAFRKLENVLDHMIEICTEADRPDAQLSLF